MATKFDQKTTKHQLFHLSLSLATVLICATYMQYNRNWTHIGNFKETLILPIVLVGEILKVLLTRFYGRINESSNSSSSSSSKLRQNKSDSFSLRGILGGLLLQVFCTMLYAFICIILGAPVLYNTEQTLCLSVLLLLLTVSPTVFLLGAGGTLEICFCEKTDFVTKADRTAVNLNKYNALGAILGAWAGSVVAPLDWDRDWQAYPIPNMIGALLGSALGNIYACIQVLYIIWKTYKTLGKKV